MAVYQLYPGAEGVANVVQLKLKDESRPDPFRLALPTSANATFMTSHTDRQGHWHTTPAIGLTIILVGHLEIHVNRAAPTIHKLGPGDMLFVMDTTGEGHCSRAYGSPEMSAMLLPVRANELNTLGEYFVNWVLT